eukprot:scaffold20655_cov51-Phaeocystis_antarctica.AAC.1
MGLVPMLPSTEVAPVLVMPALVSRQKAAAVPRLMTARTGHGGCGVEVGGGVGATIVVAIIVTDVCANPRPLSEPRAPKVIAVAHKMMPSACASAKIVATPATCQKMLLGLAPLRRTTSELAMKLSPWAICMIHTVARVRVRVRVRSGRGRRTWRTGVEVEFLAHCHRHDSGPLVHATRQRDAANEPTEKLHGLRVCASRSVNVCSLHVRDGLSHKGWCGDGIVRRVESATDQRRGRELAGGIKRNPKAGHGRPSDGAGADVAGHRGHAGSGNAGFCQKCKPLRGADVNSRQGVGGRAGWIVEAVVHAPRDSVAWPDYPPEGFPGVPALAHFDAAVPSGLPAAVPPLRAPTPGAAGRRDSVRRLGRPRPTVAVRVIEQCTFAQAAAPDQMEADATGRGQAGNSEDLGNRLGRAVIGHARPLRGLVPVVAGRGDQRALAHGDELGEVRGTIVGAGAQRSQRTAPTCGKC